MVVISKRNLSVDSGILSIKIIILSAMLLEKKTQRAFSFMGNAIMRCSSDEYLYFISNFAKGFNYKGANPIIQLKANEPL